MGKGFFVLIAGDHKILTEELLDKINVLHLEGTAVEVFQGTGIGGELEDQFIGVQSLTMAAVLAVLTLVAVLAVADEGMAVGGELGADLVGAAGNKVTLHEGQAVLHSQRFI